MRAVRLPLALGAGGEDGAPTPTRGGGFSPPRAPQQEPQADAEFDPVEGGQVSDVRRGGEGVAIVPVHGRVEGDHG